MTLNRCVCVAVTAPTQNVAISSESATAGVGVSRVRSKYSPRKGVVILRKALLSICASVLTLGLLAGPLLSQTGDVTIPIDISPNTINIESDGAWVTVHAEIPYGVVDYDYDVTLNGIVVELTKADNRGDLVAKFCVDDVKDIVEPGTAELTLHGVTDTGVEFTGKDTIKVIKVSGNK